MYICTHIYATYIYTHVAVYYYLETDFRRHDLYASSSDDKNIDASMRRIQRTYYIYYLDYIYISYILICVYSIE